MMDPGAIANKTLWLEFGWRREEEFVYSAIRNRIASWEGVLLEPEKFTAPTVEKAAKHIYDLSLFLACNADKGV